MIRFRWPWVAVAVVAALTGPGCGSGKVKVNGVLMLDGKPVEGAIVTFVPVEQGKAQTAHGTTDKDGAFQLTTSKPNDGAFPGEYKITVVYAEGAEPPPAGGMKDAFTGFEKAQKKKLPPPKYNVPAKYRDPAKSDLKQKVPTGGTVTLDLKSGK